MNIAVYCGAALGNLPSYRQATIQLGEWIAQHRHTLVYGGGKAGLMAWWQIRYFPTAAPLSV